MKIKRNDLAGTGKVYRFTLSQMLKGKANIISVLILFLVTGVSIPVMGVMMGGEKTESSDITAVYVQNDTGYQLDFDSIPVRDEMFAETEFVNLGSKETEPIDVESEETESENKKSIEDGWSEESYQSRISPEEVYMHLEKNEEQMNFTVGAFTLEDKEFTDEDLDFCVSAVSGLLDEARYVQQNADPEQIEVLTSPYNTRVQSVSEYLEEKGDDDYEARFGAQLIYSILLLMLCTFVSSYIIQKVIEEKASKLAELLMVSVSPLAMLLGKILAVMAYVFGLFAGLAAVGGISYAVTGQFMDISFVQQLEAAGISLETLRLSPVAVLVLVISLLLGYLQVSLISGLIGTGCSSTEDVEPANLTIVLLVFVGYFIAIITVGFGENLVLSSLVSVFPVVSMFCAPVRYLVGDIGIGMVALSWLIQLAVIWLLACVCARIYRALMMYRGNRMKLRGWIAMFRQNRREEAEDQ